MLPEPVLSVVIPMYNEGEIVAKVLDVVQDALRELPEPYEIVVVDDGSRDNTWEQIAACCRKCKRIRAFRLSRNFGKEPAVRAGLTMARGAAVVTLDGDLQHPPSLIMQMYRIWRDEKVPVVEAVKSDRGRENVFYKFCSQTFYKYFRKLARISLEGASDFKLLDRQVVNVLLSMNEKALFYRGMAAWVGFQRKQVPFEVQERVGGRTQWSLRMLARLFVHGLAAYTAAPLHLVTLAGTGCLTLGLILGFISCLSWLVGGSVSGHTAIAVLLLMIGGGILTGLGIIGVYLTLIYEEVKNRPAFVIAEAMVGDISARAEPSQVSASEKPSETQ